MVENLLCHRQQTVRVGNSMSVPMAVASGIPQGTILGLLMLILYIDAIADLNFSSQLKLYANDAKLYRNSYNAYQSNLLQSDLLNIEHCFKTGNLMLILTNVR